MTFVIVSGGIDLSVGAVAAFTSMFLAVAIERWKLPPAVAVAAILVLAAGFGSLIGLGVRILRTPPFILTLAAMFLARGGCFLLSKEAVAIRHPTYQRIGGFALALPGGLSLSTVALMMMMAFLIGGVLLHRTRWGGAVYAIGGDSRAAELIGLPVDRIVVSTYAVSGLCGALAGIALSFYTAAGNPLAAQGLELDAIAAAVIGGALLSGGSGRVAGSFLGVLIQGLILLYITFDGRISSWWTRITIGALLFAFVGIQKLMGRWSGRNAVGSTP